MKLITTLFILFILVSQAHSFDLESSRRYFLKPDVPLITAQQAYLKQFPQCQNYQACQRTYELLSAHLYKSEANEYFYRVVVLDRTIPQRPPRRSVHLVGADVEVLNNSAEDNTTDQ